jgi:methylated-DNA-[protein]-cysteine S-methyltransferase
VFKEVCETLLRTATRQRDMNFRDKVYAKLREVPKGKVTTYKDLANALGTAAYRAVGTAMNKNPDAPRTPCHRVINADGRLGGFASGLTKKIQMLKEEGVEIVNEKIDLNKFRHEF